MAGLPCYADIPAVIRQLRPVRSLYCFHGPTLRRNVAAFQRLFPGRLAWAVKANPAPVIVDAIVAAGVRDFDVASLNEIIALRAACPEAVLHYNHPVKAREDIAAAWHEYGVRNFTVDCRAEIDKIAEALPGTPLADALLLVRFIDPRKTPGSDYNFDTKFGALPDEAADCLRHAHALGFKLGLSFHPGSQCENPQSYIDLLHCAHRIAQAAAAVPLIRLNIGGGFPVVYDGSHVMAQDDYMGLIGKTLAQLLAEWPGGPPELICEPGRALVAECCALLTRVELRRYDHRLHINDGTYGGLTEQHFVGFRPPVIGYKADGALLPTDAMRDFTIFGPTCDSLDQLKQRYRLSAAIAEGDYIAFGMMGAYSNASATNFNGVPPAGFVRIERAPQ